ncbi:hypothetical protein COL516b_002937 [Colletotrichum fioriniae]|nr:uncharacterized protein COL516b_002937 [Colletotrichum fioriniae]KAJ0309686.1 hypothetical protein COL516b_002937 [Colletotrichum fioriniae]
MRGQNGCHTQLPDQSISSEDTHGDDVVGGGIQAAQYIIQDGDRLARIKGSSYQALLLPTAERNPFATDIRRVTVR